MMGAEGVILPTSSPGQETIKNEEQTCTSFLALPISRNLPVASRAMELEHLLQVAAAGGAQEARIVVGLKDKVDGERDMIVIESGATEVVKLEANKMSAPLSSSVKRLCGSCGKRGRDVGFMQSISVAVFKLREFSYKLVAKNH